MDGTGWGSAFLFVPEVVNIDRESLARLTAAGEDDIDLSGASPLGVPFWSLRTSSQRGQQRLQRIADGKPGSRCPKGYLVSNTEFTATPICTASRALPAPQAGADRRLGPVGPRSSGGPRSRWWPRPASATIWPAAPRAPWASIPRRPRPSAAAPTRPTSSQVTTLDGMVDHIYGRASLPLESGTAAHAAQGAVAASGVPAPRHRPARRGAVGARWPETIAECRDNLQRGVQHYPELAGRLVAAQREPFQRRLDQLRQELKALVASGVTTS